MITQSSEMAIRSMIYLAVQDDPGPVSPRRLAKAMDCSASYLAKVLRGLTKAGLLKSYQGASGGVVLERHPGAITLLEMIEASQGLFLAHYCQEVGEEIEPVCAYHHAMWDLYSETKKVLSGWTLAMLAAKPLPDGPIEGHKICRMAFMSGVCAECPGVERSGR